MIAFLGGRALPDLAGSVRWHPAFGPPVEGVEGRG
jgi:hypothetical protein